MSFPRYPKYKDSGVEWLGQVPEHWWSGRNKVVFSEVDDRTEDEDGELLTVSHITGVTSRAEKEVNMFMAETLAGYKRCQVGDLVINTMWAWMGALGCSPLNGLVSPSYNIYRPRKSAQLLPSYYDYLCRVPSHRTVIKAHSTGIWESRLRLYPDAFLSMCLALPPLPEQTAIAAFLDRETGKIDELVAEQQRLLELLKEKRQAVISHAVTKGLNPNAPMKPSGIECLGEIPAHWNTGRLAYLAELLVDGTHFSPPSWPDGAYMYITAKNIKEHGFDFSELTYVTAEEHSKIYPRCPVRRNDVLYIKDGATAGVAMVNPLEDQFSMLSSVALIRPIAKILNPTFVAYHLNAGQFKNDAVNKLVGGAMTRFTVDMIKRGCYESFCNWL